jgi:Fe-S cluster assembly protein SufD
VLQRWSASTWHIATHRGVLERDARLRFFAATFGSRLQKAYWDALLEGAGADATLTGVCFGGGDQHLDHQSLQAHRAPSTHSDLLLKVAVRDRAQSVYGGLISVDKVAQKTDGYVQNRNLMLSRGARASGIPMLEIKANDVRCSHGVTAGHVDTDQRFYLQSRGVQPEAADRLIVRGFMQDAVDRCPHPGFAEFVGTVLDEVVAGHSAAGLEAEALS